MSNNYTQISLTFCKRGESLVKAGVYSSAEIEVKNPFHSLGKNWRQKTSNKFVAGDEELIIKKSMRVLEEPVYEKAKVQVTLSKAFLEGCLEGPQKRPKMSNDEYNIFRNWGKLSLIQKVDYHVSKYVQDMGGSEYEFKLL